MKDRSILWVFLAFFLGFALPVCSCVGTSVIAVGALSRFAQQPMPQISGVGDAVGVMQLDGAINAGPQASFTASGIWPARVRSLLDQAAADPSIKAVVVRVNSPGGAVVPSDEIYRSLSSFEKPVVISMGSVAASGGYYISCAGDHIMAHPDTLTGSIGVISSFLNTTDLLDKVGVDVVVLASGPRKDIGSPYREMTEEEKELWQNIIDVTYENFVDVVAEARNMPEDQIRELADGSIYVGEQAQELGLVDALGTRQAAIEKAAELGGIAGTPRVINLTPQPSFLEMFYGFQSRSAMPELQELIGWTGMPSLEYRVAEP